MTKDNKSIRQGDLGSAAFRMALEAALSGEVLTNEKGQICFVNQRGSVRFYVSGPGCGF